MKSIAIVVQRFGSDIVGGAEQHAREVALKLNASGKYQITIITTCAKSYQTWSNEFKPGESLDGSLRVIRFRNSWRRLPRLMWISSKFAFGLRRRFPQSILTRPVQVCAEKLWIIAQGPYCPSLVQYLKHHQNDFDRVILFTYLYYPTIKSALSIKPDRTVLIPTAHDEAPFYMRSIHRLFTSVDEILCNTEPERSLVSRVHKVPIEKIKTVGLGFDLDFDVKPLSESELVQLGIGSSPYVLFLGRISRGKGAHELVDCFSEFLRQNPTSELRLVLAGKIEDVEIPMRERILALGYVADQLKFRLIRSSLALINPSAHESLSMIVLEALASKVPVIANSACEVFRYYQQHCPAFFTYASKSELKHFFERIESRQLFSPSEADPLQISADWVLANYSWSRVVEKFDAIL